MFYFLILHFSFDYIDLVGFTKWSNGREPGDVFALLETIYGEFDRLARQRRVFKIETIGGKCIYDAIPGPNDAFKYID